MPSAAKRRKRSKRRGKFGRVLLLVLFLAVAFGLVRFKLLPSFYPQKYQEQVSAYAAEYQLPESLVYAVIKTESDFDPYANSHKDARGLMQILLSTGSWAAEKLGLENYTDESLYDVDTNLHIGCWYLARLYEQFGSIPVALAAYNAGEGNVSRWLTESAYSADGETLDTIPYPATDDYVKTVLRRQMIYEKLYE